MPFTYWINRDWDGNLASAYQHMAASGQPGELVLEAGEVRACAVPLALGSYQAIRGAGVAVSAVQWAGAGPGITAPVAARNVTLEGFTHYAIGALSAGVQIGDRAVPFSEASFAQHLRIEHVELQRPEPAAVGSLLAPALSLSQPGYARVSDVLVTNYERAYVLSRDTVGRYDSLRALGFREGLLITGEETAGQHPNLTLTHLDMKGPHAYWGGGDGYLLKLHKAGSVKVTGGELENNGSGAVGGDAFVVLDGVAYIALRDLALSYTIAQGDTLSRTLRAVDWYAVTCDGCLVYTDAAPPMQISDPVSGPGYDERGRRFRALASCSPEFRRLADAANPAFVEAE